MASKQAINQANMRYAKKAYDRIALNLKKGNKELLQNYARENGKSVNGLIVEMLAEKIPNFKV